MEIINVIIDQVGIKRGETKANSETSSDVLWEHY